MSVSAAAFRRGGGAVALAARLAARVGRGFSGRGEPFLVTSCQTSIERLGLVRFGYGCPPRSHGPSSAARDPTYRVGINVGNNVFEDEETHGPEPGLPAPPLATNEPIVYQVASA